MDANNVPSNKKKNATNEDSEVEKDAGGVGVRVGVEGVRRSRRDGGVIESGSCVCIKVAKPKEKKQGTEDVNESHQGPHTSYRRHHRIT